jgi:trans-aconitate 2-methyltransferase
MVYHQIMESPAAIVEWMPGTGMRPYLDSLDSDEERRHFVALLAERVAASYPRRSDGTVLFPFSRLSVIAYA